MLIWAPLSIVIRINLAVNYAAHFDSIFMWGDPWNFECCDLS